jgi:hypothetical protein
MSKTQEEVNSTGESVKQSDEPITWRTPGRKLSKEDLSATSALILGCTNQCCDGQAECSADLPITG